GVCFRRTRALRPRWPAPYELETPAVHLQLVALTRSSVCRESIAIARFDIGSGTSTLDRGRIPGVRRAPYAKPAIRPQKSEKCRTNSLLPATGRLIWQAIQTARRHLKIRLPATIM